MSDWRLRLFPPGKREWGEAYLADFGIGSGLIRVVVYAWYLTIRRNPVTTVVIATSLTVVATGTHLAWLALLQHRPPVVNLLAFTLVLQGSYTLVYMSGRLSALEPMASSALFAGEAAALLASLSGFGSTLFEYVRWIDQTPIGPMAVRVLIAAQALFTILHYTVGQGTILSPNRGAAGGSNLLIGRRAGRDESRRLTESLAATGIMLLGLLVVDLIATPRLRAMPWDDPPRRGGSIHDRQLCDGQSEQVTEPVSKLACSLAYVAIPTLGVFFVFWRDLGDLRQVVPGLTILTSGAITGAGLLTLHDKRSEPKPRAESTVGS